MTKKLNLTFGIEIECNVRYDPSTYTASLAAREPAADSGIFSNSDFDRNRLFREHVARELGTHGYTVHDERGHQAQQPSQSWIVGHDDSICHSRLGQTTHADHIYCDIELKSPVFKFSPVALTEVHEFVSLFTRLFDVKIDWACGFHVHVGNQRKGFPLQTLKNFSILTTVCEQHFSSLHPPDRVLGNTWVRRQTETFGDMHPWDIAKSIQSCENRKQLVGLYSSNPDYLERDVAYSLCPLVMKPRFNTIEFRQHEGTTDTQVIMSWIGLACGVVTSAHEMAFEDLTQLVDDVAFDPRMDVISLLFGLQLGGSAAWYQGRERYVHPKPARAWVDKTMGKVVEGRERSLYEVYARSVGRW